MGSRTLGSGLFVSELGTLNSIRNLNYIICATGTGTGTKALYESSGGVKSINRELIKYLKEKW